jgi:hypothetical protein
MENSTLLLIVAIIVIFYFFSYGNRTIQEFENSPEETPKDVDELDNLHDIFNDITVGNPVSVANKEAPTNDKTQTQQNGYVYFGTPINLEDNYMPVPQQSQLYFKNNTASPECCPSTYTTDLGCVCWTPQQQEYRRQNSAISPSS